MDVVLHPRFADNHWVYLSYHRPVGEDAGETMLARGRWENGALIDVRDIFATGATGTEGSRIGFATDGTLHMTMSAPGVGPDVVRSQDPQDYAGKTIRLRDDGSIPADNPFVKDSRYLPAIYTLGHRNGHSMALNPWTDELWVTEQGPDGGDEINVLQPGANYGWPLVSYGRAYSGPRISPNPTLEGTVGPLVFWVPSIAVTGMTFYQGDVFTAWRRSAFVGGLREGEVPRSGQLQRIEFNDRWEEIRREPMLRELNQRIRDVREGPDGLLYVLTAEAQVPCFASSRRTERHLRRSCYFTAVASISIMRPGTPASRRRATCRAADMPAAVRRLANTSAAPRIRRRPSCSS